MATEWQWATRMLAIQTRRARRRTIAILSELVRPRLQAVAAATLTLAVAADVMTENAAYAQDVAGPGWNQPTFNLPRPGALNGGQ